MAYRHPSSRASKPVSEGRIEGTVERITYHSEDTGFCVLKLKARGHRELVTVVGQLPRVAVGEWARALGEWTVDPKHGRQFKASEIQALPPESEEGIERFLGSGLIKGIGPVYAAKLVKVFGKDVLDVIDKRSAQLEKVPGIGRMRRLQIKEGWNEAKYVRAIMTFLLSYGVSANRAFRIYKTYGEKAVDKVKENPYCLARDIRGIGFKTADDIASRMKIAKDHPLRAEAGLEHALLEFTGQGDCAAPESVLIEAAEKMLDIPEDLLRPALKRLENARRVFIDRTFDAADPLVYLSALYRQEQELADRLNRYHEGPSPYPRIDMDKAIPWVEQRMKLELADAQKQAIRQAFQSKVMILTGGPGVGKTTLIRAIIDIAAAKKLNIVQAAPTGRAAKRMAETTGREAKTIHRLLAFEPGTGRFKHNEHQPLKGDVFIIDESSMIDLPLAHALVSALPFHSAVIWVGDKDQLPSVGPGTVLTDLIHSDRFAVCRLTHIFRQAAASRIVTAAHEINSGSVPKVDDAPRDSDFFFIKEEDPERMVQKAVDLCRKHIPQRLSFDPVRDIQVLTPMQRGVLGARNMNRQLQEALNPRGDSIERFGQMFRVGDKVMQLENDYDKDVFNGDMGVVHSIERDEETLNVDFMGRKVAYRWSELDELTPSYAITIHKSQGSEYPCVIVLLHTQHFVMLERNLLYTAVTRGKQMVILLGRPQAVGMAVSRQRMRTRISALTRRLQNAQHPVYCKKAVPRPGS